MDRKYSTKELRVRPWWVTDKYRAHDALFSLMTYLDEKQNHYIKDDWVHWRLFDNDAALRAIRRTPRRRDDVQLTLNVIRSCVTTAHSRITQTKPRPTYLTIGQGQRARAKAKKTQAYSDALIYHTDGYQVCSDAMMSGCLFGNGEVKTSRCRQGGLPRAENVPLYEIRVEHEDGRNARPRAKYHYRPVAREELLEEYEGDSDALDLIRNAPDARSEYCIYDHDLADQVMVCEAYRRPRIIGGSGGRHVVALENGTLEDEDWTRDIPIRSMIWGKRPAGWRGYGIAEQLKGLQLEINWTLLTASEQLRLSGPKLCVERGSHVNEEEINNEIWGLIYYTGTEPKQMMLQTVDPALLQHVADCRQRALEEVGLSQMSVQGQKPAGLNSGRAIRTFSDLETVHFQGVGQRYESLVRDVANDLLDFALDDVEEDGPTKTILAPVKERRRRFLAKIKKSDIVSSRDEFICQVYPTSALSQNPAQKMEQVGDWQDRGWVQPTEAMQLLDFPDLDNATSLAIAPLEYIDLCIDRMLEDGEVMHPEPWIDLRLARERVTHALLRAQVDKVPESRWQLLAAYAQACGNELAKQAAAAAPPMPPGSPPALPGPGAPPPGAPAGMPV